MSNLKFSNKFIIKNTLDVIKQFLSKIKGSDNLKLLIFPEDINESILNNHNIDKFVSKKFKLRSQFLEILTLISFYQNDEDKFISFLLSILQYIFSNFIFMKKINVSKNNKKRPK